MKNETSVAVLYTQRYQRPKNNPKKFEKRDFKMITAPEMMLELNLAQSIVFVCKKETENCFSVGEEIKMVDLDDVAQIKLQTKS